MFFWNSDIRLRESGLLQGYTDYHCHLLPGVDDGVQQTTMTYGILDLMQQHGVKDVWFTPHVMEDMPNTPEDLRKVMDSLDLSRYDMNITLSAENMLDANFSVERARQLPHANEGILVETSYFTPPYDLDGMLSDIMSSGLYPTLAHPCRYEYMGEKDYERLLEMRIRFQLNLPSVCGLYGKHVQNKAFWLMDHGYYSITGTDTHSLRQYEALLETKISRKRIKQLENIIR